MYFGHISLQVIFSFPKRLNLSPFIRSRYFQRIETNVQLFVVVSFRRMKKPHCCNILALKTTTFRTKEIIKRKKEIIISRTEGTKTPPSLSLAFFLYVCLSIPLLFSSSPPTVPSAFLFIFPSFFVYVSLSLPIVYFYIFTFFTVYPSIPFLMSYSRYLSSLSLSFSVFIFVVYFDQLLGAARTQKIVEQLFSAVFNLFCSF